MTSPGYNVGDLYLAWARNLRSEEREMRDRLLPRLPPRVVDCHTHSSPPHAITGFSDYAWAQARSSFPIWTAEHSDGVRELLFGDADVTRLVMAYPFRGFDHRVANDYLTATATPSRRAILMGLPDDEPYTTAALRTGRFNGLKMYPAYREPVYGSVHQYFPAWALAAAASSGVPVVVHLPALISECVGDVVAIARRHPDLTIVLAHLGREPSVNVNVVEAFARAAALPRICVDTSMAIAPDMHRLALAAFGPKRVLYGSDEPFNLFRYTQFLHPERGLRLMGPQRYHWIEPQMYEEYSTVAAKATLVHLQVLDAVISSVDRDFPQQAGAVLDRIFRENARELFGLGA